MVDFGLIMENVDLKAVSKKIKRNRDKVGILSLCSEMTDKNKIE